MDFHWVYPVLFIFVLDGSSTLVLRLTTCHNKGEQGKVWESARIPIALEDCSGIRPCVFCQKFKGDGGTFLLFYTLAKYLPRPSKTHYSIPDEIHIAMVPILLPS